MHILRRYHGPAQEDRTEEGIGPQAPKAGEKPQAPGEGSERENQIGKAAESRVWEAAKASQKDRRRRSIVNDIIRDRQDKR